MDTREFEGVRGACGNRCVAVQAGGQTGQPRFWAGTEFCVRRGCSTVKRDSPIFADTKIGTVPVFHRRGEIAPWCAVALEQAVLGLARCPGTACSKQWHAVMRTAGKYLTLRGRAVSSLLPCQRADFTTTSGQNRCSFTGKTGNSPTTRTGRPPRSFVHHRDHRFHFSHCPPNTSIA
jgi:hypothetical protein